MIQIPMHWGPMRVQNFCPHLEGYYILLNTFTDDVMLVTFDRAIVINYDKIQLIFKRPLNYSEMVVETSGVVFVENAETEVINIRKYLYLIKYDLKTIKNFLKMRRLKEINKLCEAKNGYSVWSYSRYMTQLKDIAKGLQEI